MPFEHACFISYRNGETALVQGFIEDLADALANELEPMLGMYPYVDHKRLKGGDFYNRRLATALCRSVCMIAVFTPTYFDLKHPYCAREYKAMERLEKQRLKALKKPVSKQHGLIIPVVFRGLKYLPQEVKGLRNYYDFSNFTLASGQMSRHQDFAQTIKSIAEYITDRHTSLAALYKDPCQHCDTFSLPSESSIKPWLKTVKRQGNAFPLREAGQ